VNSKNLVILLKRVSKIGNGPTPSGTGRIISLPKVWVVEHKDPRKVAVCLGDLLIVGPEDLEERVQQAADCLIAQGLLKPLGEAKNPMRIVGEKHGLLSVG